MLKIGISGACGKMGRRIAELAIKDPDIEIVSAIEKDDYPGTGKDLGLVLGADELGVEVTSDPAGACGGIDCLIEFTLPAPTLEHLEVCRKEKVPMVIGTTGLEEGEVARIREASGVIPIVFSPNMAVGVNLLFNIVREAAGVLGGDFSIKIDETHHVHKKDSPSGTAKMIATIVKRSTGVEPPIEAFREGEVIGNHGIVFEGEYERLEIRHDARSRDVFAAGALKAAKFLSGRSPGLYSMTDVLGLSR
ncbi:MAG: 4-hydroxy-tetrahydrodipicolinate reductase [Candidatus Omnitrophota bacterium]|nr:4-hydroxy-tetrahydrodipicolinate reductase [Candidatus Omnitrophota bacterium]